MRTFSYLSSWTATAVTEGSASHWGGGGGGGGREGERTGRNFGNYTCMYIVRVCTCIRTQTLYETCTFTTTLIDMVRTLNKQLHVNSIAHTILSHHITLAQ